MSGIAERRARFAAREETPATLEKLREGAAMMDRLAVMVGELLTTGEVLWDENERLQEGIDRQMGIVAQLRAELGRRDALIQDLVEYLPSLVWVNHYHGWVCRVCDANSKAESVCGFQHKPDCLFSRVERSVTPPNTADGG